MKRKDYISWDNYFMAVAQISAQRSKDPSTQVGSCIVDNENRIIGIGYNGFPTGCSDDFLPWKSEGGFLDTKYAYVLHSEVSAIASVADRNQLKKARLYTTLEPCNECAKLITQVGIREVLYIEGRDDELHEAARRIFALAGVSCRRMREDKRDITIKLYKR